MICESKKLNLFLQKEVAARKKFYSQLISSEETKLKVCLIMANVVIPCVAVVFMVVFWIIGLVNYYSEV